MALRFLLINKEKTRCAPLTSQAQLDEVVPVMNRAMNGTLGNGKMNDAVFDVLEAKGMLPDFTGPDSEAYETNAKRKR